MNSTRLSITEKALFQRLARRLRRDNEYLHKSRSERMEIEFGRYYAECGRNYISRTNIDLERLGRELNILAPWESIQGDKGAAMPSPARPIQAEAVEKGRVQDAN